MSPQNVNPVLAKVVLERRNEKFTEKDKAILDHIFEETKKYRKD